jgi:hypothetical protein
VAEVLAVRRLALWRQQEMSLSGVAGGKKRDEVGDQEEMSKDRNERGWDPYTCGHAEEKSSAYNPEDQAHRTAWHQEAET